MPRHLLDDLFAGQLTTWTVVRAKCRYGPSHESVRLVDGQWWGEDCRDFECSLAPQDTCPVCDGAGAIMLTGAEAELARFDGARPTGRPCPPCDGTGYVPGPHWPWRYEQPPPLRVKD